MPVRHSCARRHSSHARLRPRKPPTPPYEHAGRCRAQVTPFPCQALEGDLLDKKSLGLVNAYQPSLTSTWMFQKSMSVGVGERVDANLIVDLLANNFKSMDKVSFSSCCALLLYAAPPPWSFGEMSHKVPFRPASLTCGGGGG